MVNIDIAGRDIWRLPPTFSGIVPIWKSHLRRGLVVLTEFTAVAIERADALLVAPQANVAIEPLFPHVAVGVRAHLANIADPFASTSWCSSPLTLMRLPLERRL